MVPSSTATLTTNRSWFPWVIGTGTGTRPGVTTLPMSRNCSRVCLCYPLSTDCCGATQWFCCVTKNFQKGPPTEKAKLRRLWTYLSQLRLSVHHIQGGKNKCADYICRNNFDDMIGARSEELGKEAFSPMDVHLDLNMTMIRPLDGLKQVEYLKEFGDIYKRLEKRLEPVLVNQEQWNRDKTYLWHEDRILVPSDHVPALLKWSHESSGYVGADRALRLFKQCFHSTWSDDQLQKALQPMVDKCPCRSCKSGDIRHRGLSSTLPIPHCANSVIHVDYTEMPKFGGYDFALVVTCGLTRFTRVIPYTKHITGEETIKILLEEWFCVYGAPKEINSDRDFRVRSDTGWYKRVLRSLNVQVSTGIPYNHTRFPLYERQIRVVKENVSIWCKTERNMDWVTLLPVISPTMNSQESSATGYSPHDLFMGRLAWFLHHPYPEDSYSTVGKWVKEQQDKVDMAKAMLRRVEERHWNKKKKHRVPSFHKHLGFYGVQKSQDQLQSEILLFLSKYTIKSIFSGVSPPCTLQIENVLAPRSTMQA